MSERLTNNRIEKMYDRYTDGFLGELRTDEFYEFFMNSIKSGERNVYLYEKYIERIVDIAWVEMIEQTIIPLDTIIRNPRRFIKNEEEILPIEMVKNVTTDGIRHLAQHTNMIAMVKGDEVTPQRMLNIHKEESFETYENRFIFTLLQKLQYFLDKRLQALMANTGAQDMLEMRLDGKFDTGKDQVAYKVEFSYTTPHVDLADEDLKINADVSTLSSMQRVERIRRILYDFMGSPLIRTLEGCALVRPPLTMTNVLTKNQDFKKAVELWMFIERYEDKGFNVKQVEREAVPTEKFLDDMLSVVALQYVISKNNSGRTEEHDDYMARRVEILPNIVRKDIDRIIENYDLEIDEVKRIFLEQAEEAQKNKYDDTAKVEAILTRAMTLENTRIAVDSKHRKSRADKIAEKHAREKKQAEREAELKRIRNEFLEKETSRIENEVRNKFEAIAIERDALRQAEEQKAAEERVAARIAEEEKAAEERAAARIADEERAAAEREAIRRAEEEMNAQEREATRLKDEERAAAHRMALSLADEQRRAAEREAARLADEERKAAERIAARIAEEEKEAEERCLARVATENKVAAAREIDRRRRESEEAEARIAARLADEEREAAEREAARLADEEEKAAERIASQIAEEQKAAEEREAARLVEEEKAAEARERKRRRREATEAKERREARKEARLAALSDASTNKKKVYRAVRRSPKVTEHEEE